MLQKQHACFHFSKGKNGSSLGTKATAIGKREMRPPIRFRQSSSIVAGSIRQIRGRSDRNDTAFGKQELETRQKTKKMQKKKYMDTPRRLSARVCRWSQPRRKNT